MDKIIEKLKENADEGNRKFISKLVPNLDINYIFGCRTPDIKKLSKELSKDEGRFAFLEEKHTYFEEINLHGSLLNTVSKDINVVLQYVDKFLPYVDNWATCDTTVSSLKIFTKYPDEVYKKVLEWLKSDKTYTVRFGVVTLLAYYLDGNFNAEIPAILAKIKSDEYYINMAIAWYFSTALAKQYDSSIGIIESKILSPSVQNKSIQKAVESFRISGERKEYLRSLKIK